VGQLIFELAKRFKVRVPVGAHAQEDRSTDEVERFLSLIRLKSRAKVTELMKEPDKNSVESGN
jgi:hypothetical protein